MLGAILSFEARVTDPRRRPRTDIRNARRIAAVMRGGFLYDGETLRPLWPAEGEAPHAWFEGMTREQWLPLSDPPNPEEHP